MTIEEITQTLERVAENQAKHAELHSRHIADIAEIDKMIAANVESLNRHDRQLDRLFEIVGVLGDRQIENDKRFAELADGMRRLEGSYELLESFVRDFRSESRDYFAETDVKLAALAGIQATTNDVLAAFIKETNGRFAETDKKLAALASAQTETDKKLIALAESQSRTDDQIKALVLSQTRTDEMVRSLVERNGSTGRPAAKVKKAKKPAAKKAKKGAK